MENLGDPRVRGRLRLGIGHVREVVFCVGRVLPVAVVHGDVAVVAVIGRLYEASSQKPHAHGEKESQRGHYFRSRSEGERAREDAKVVGLARTLKGPGEKQREQKSCRVDAMHTQDCPVISLHYIKT